MNKEIWKDIEGYEGLYQVSNYGRVKSLDRFVVQKHYSGYNSNHVYKSKIIYQSKNRYCSVTLWKNSESKRYSVHRLVANAFLDYNKYKYTEKDINKEYNKEQLIINHKDENKLNNNVNNLEWCTTSYNNRYGDNTNGKFKKVYQYSIDGKLINEFKSIQECSRILNINSRSLNRHCHKEDLFKGYIFKLDEEM